MHRRQCIKTTALEIRQPPAGIDAKEFDRQHQKSEFTRSIANLRRHLG